MLKLPRCRSFVLPLLVMGCVTWVAAQGPQYGTIVGQLRLARSAFPPKAVLVNLETRGATIASVYTDNEGRFTFSQLLGNPYRVIINDADYSPVDELVALDPSTSAIRMLNITLVPKSDVAAVRAGTNSSAIAGGNPNVTNPGGLRREVPEPALREFKAGVNAEHKKKLDDASRHYQKAIEIAPDFYEARNNLGSLQLAKSDFDAAREQFQAALKSNPSEASSQFNMANLMLLTKQPADAEKYAREGLRLQPTSAFGHFVLGSALGSTGDTAEAERELHRALELDPATTKAHLALVNIYLQQKKKQEAIAELRSFLKSAPDDPFAPKARDVLTRLESEQ